MEVAQQIRQEKEMQASMMIGAQSARLGIKSGGKGDVRFGSDKGSVMDGNNKKENQKPAASKRASGQPKKPRRLPACDVPNQAEAPPCQDQPELHTPPLTKKPRGVRKQAAKEK